MCIHIETNTRIDTLAHTHILCRTNPFFATPCPPLKTYERGCWCGCDFEKLKPIMQLNNNMICLYTCHRYTYKCT